MQHQSIAVKSFTWQIIVKIRICRANKMKNYNLIVIMLDQGTALNVCTFLKVELEGCT